jgi:3-oxoacyl-[acyl-carrier protein] reductase
MTHPTLLNSQNIALVTGVGRQQGIGYAIVEMLLRHGVRVVYTYHRPYDTTLFPNDIDDPAHFAESWAHLGVSVLGVPSDLSLVGSGEKLMQDVVSQMGVPTILVNNAAVSLTQSFLSLTPEVLDQHYAVNVKATLFLIQSFAQRTCTAPRRILNMTSGQALGPMPDELAYTITKAGVDMMTIQLAPELLPMNISCFALDPGATDTGWITPQIRSDIERDTPGLHIKSPLEVSEAVRALLASHDTPTGSVVHAPR